MGEPEPQSTENPFSDVDSVKHKNFYKAILWAAEQGITGGFKNGTFQPERSVTRAEFVTFLHRAYKTPKLNSTKNPFADVYGETAHKNFKNAILWAYENEITLGKDASHFQPDLFCTRGQVVTFLYRSLINL